MSPPAALLETHQGSVLAGVEGRKDSTPAFYQCYLIQRTGNSEVRIPLQFIPMGDI